MKHKIQQILTVTIIATAASATAASATAASTTAASTTAANTTATKATVAAPKSLLQVFNIASKDNATYQAALSTFQANKQNIPIAFGPLLPKVDLAAAIQYNYTNAAADNQKSRYISVNPTNPLVTITQNLFDWSLWKTYTQSQYQFKADAITLAQNRQQLILNTATAYFNILQSEDQVKFSKANLQWNKELYEQSEQKFKVGISPITDVQSSRANYESAIATYVATENMLTSAKNNLYQITGKKITHIKELSNNFPFTPPTPKSASAWVNTALTSNLDLIQSQFDLQAKKESISIAWGAFIPSVNASATFNRTLNYQTTQTSANSTATLGINASWNILNGGSDYAIVKQNKFIALSAQSNTKQIKRNTESETTQSYLTVVSDISQIQALKQSVLANESSVKAMKAGYNVGTQTIVDLLQRQQILFNTQQQYAKAKYSYINDYLKLKQQAGNLTIKDIQSINKWLS
jgi:outer membrane protein